MFLTGFDAPTLNTLFVDKNLRFHGLIQAYSRTNRIYDATKTFGNIVTFRDLEQATMSHPERWPGRPWSCPPDGAPPGKPFADSRHDARRASRSIICSFISLYTMNEGFERYFFTIYKKIVRSFLR
jgi:hypothetical protein